MGLSNSSTTAFQLIAFNELFETAFNSLYNNITNNVTGFTLTDTAVTNNSPTLSLFNETTVNGTSTITANNALMNRTQLLDIVRTARAQEEQHALGALAILRANNAFAPGPCEYQFGTTNLTQAINLIETNTAVVLGPLQDANYIFAQSSQPGAVRLISSVIGQEGEQNGYFRIYLERSPSDSPFLMTVPSAFTFSALQSYVVPGSCNYSLSNVNLPIYPPIMTNNGPGPVATIAPQDQTLNFTADLSGNSSISSFAQPYQGGNRSGLYMTYTTGQLLPVSVPLGNVTWDGLRVNFTAPFPFSQYVMQGFSHGTLTTRNGLNSSGAVVNASLAGPAAIQANELLGQRGGLRVLRRDGTIAEVHSMI